MYNGWNNYETWNVALWISNDEFLYDLARNSSSYRSFLYKLRGIDSLEKHTPDGVDWLDVEIDVDSIDELINDL